MTDSAILRGSGLPRCLRCLVLGLGAALLLLLRDRMSRIDLAAGQGAVSAIPPLHWLASFGFAAAGSLSSQDSRAHGPDRRAVRLDRPADRRRSPAPVGAVHAGGPGPRRPAPRGIAF